MPIFWSTSDLADSNSNVIAPLPAPDKNVNDLPQTDTHRCKNSAHMMRSYPESRYLMAWKRNKRP